MAATVTIANKLQNRIKLTLPDDSRSYELLSTRDIANGAYGLTFGIPQDFWETWVWAHRELEAVKNGMLFVSSFQK